MHEGMFTEKDWKLFRKMVPVWQKRYMEKLIEEYKTLLSSEAEAFDKFWSLEHRMKRDKKKTGVCIMDMSRSQMVSHIIELLDEKAITMEDLDSFSDGLRERMALLYTPRSK